LEYLVAFFPTPSTTSAIKNPGNTEEDPDNPDSANEGAIQMEYSPDHLNTPSVEAISKNDLRSVWVPFDKLDKTEFCCISHLPQHITCYPIQFNLFHIISPIIL
jgi:hypothetical protein